MNTLLTNNTDPQQQLKATTELTTKINAADGDESVKAAQASGMIQAIQADTTLDATQKQELQDTIVRTLQPTKEAADTADHKLDNASRESTAAAQKDIPANTAVAPAPIASSEADTSNVTIN